jgi:hypothetical protein
MRHSVAAGNSLVCSHLKLPGGLCSYGGMHCCRVICGNLCPCAAGPAADHHAALNLHCFVLCTCKRVRQGDHALDQVLACVLHPMQITPRTICYWAVSHLGPTWEGIPSLGQEPCLTTHQRKQGCPRTAVLPWLVQRSLPLLHSESRTAKCEPSVTASLGDSLVAASSR